jgi:ligand-binding sensor domain-containing protein
VSRIALLIFWFSLAPSAFGQLGNWKAHTSMSNVTAVADAGAAVWASSSGGVFYVDRQSGEIRSLTAVDGLHAVAAATIAYDSARDALWVGYDDGVVERVDAQSLVIESFLDISRASQFSRRGINRIVVRGDSLFVCTDFGIVVFDPVKGEVRDAYTRLGSLAAATPVYDVEFASSDDGDLALWLGTGGGVAWARLAAANLQDPSAWTVETLPQEEVLSLAYSAGVLFAGTESDVYRRDSADEYTVLGLTRFRIPHLDAVGDALVGVSQFLVLIGDGEGVWSRFSVEDADFPSSVVSTADGLWVGTRGSGLVRASVPASGSTGAQPKLAEYEPEGPSSSVFSDLAAAPDGGLWAAGVVGSLTFHRLNPDGSWTDFGGVDDPVLQDIGSFTNVASGEETSGWAASEGGGLAYVESDGSVQLFEETNSSLLSATGFPGFIVVRGVTTDNNGGVWVTTRASPVPLHYRSPDGTWTGLPPYVGEGLTSRSTAYDDVYIDSFGQKWLIVREETDFRLIKGLAVIDTGADPSDPSDDAFRFFGTKGGGGQGLPGRGVRSVVEDGDGLVWVGTEEGLAYFVNTGVVARDPSAVAIWPQRADRSEGTFLFLGLPINDLAVDPANRLWLATNDGIRVVEAVEDGFEEVLRLTSDSSPLLSNIVLSVEILPERGEAYFATDAGLVSVEIDAVSPAASVQNLFVFPNPVRVRDASQPEVTIRGLVDRMDVSIVSGLGVVVARFSTRGGQASWNLRDNSGRLVPSGVYLVVAVAEDGDGTAYGKIAVIN